MALTAVGILTRILGRYVSLVDIKNWFPVVNSQKMTVSDCLSAELRNAGVTWPPNASAFEQCPTYRRAKGSSASPLGAPPWPTMPIS